MTLEQDLMRRIRAQYGEAIRSAIQGSPFPESLLAALTANESGGNLAASRFEPAVFADLALVVLGKKSAYGAIGGKDIETYLPAQGSPYLILLSLVNLATSWGPTQIMGWHAVAGHYALSDLSRDPARHFQRAVDELTDFRKQFSLDRIPTFEAYFRCWNTGKPNGVTKDPSYLPNGLARLALYEALEEQHA